MGFWEGFILVSSDVIWYAVQFCSKIAGTIWKVQFSSIFHCSQTRLSDLTNSTSFLWKTVNTTIIDSQQSQFKSSQKHKLNLILSRDKINFVLILPRDTSVQISTVLLPQMLCCLGPVAFLTSLSGKEVWEAQWHLKRAETGQYFALSYRSFICLDGFLKIKQAIWRKCLLYNFLNDFLGNNFCVAIVTP